MGQRFAHDADTCSVLFAQLRQPESVARWKVSSQEVLSDLQIYHVVPGLCTASSSHHFAPVTVEVDGSVT